MLHWFYFIVSTASCAKRKHSGVVSVLEVVIAASEPQACPVCDRQSQHHGSYGNKAASCSQFGFFSALHLEPCWLSCSLSKWCSRSPLPKMADLLVYWILTGKKTNSCAPSNQRVTSHLGSRSPPANPRLASQLEVSCTSASYLGESVLGSALM